MTMEDVPENVSEQLKTEAEESPLDHLRTAEQIKLRKTQKEIHKIIHEVNHNRTKCIESFVKAFLAVNAPPDFDYAWVVNNCTLRMQNVYDHQTGQFVDKYWIELKDL